MRLMLVTKSGHWFKGNEIIHNPEHNNNTQDNLLECINRGDRVVGLEDENGNNRQFMVDAIERFWLE